MRARIPFIVVKGRSVPVRGGRGRRSAPERKDVKYGDDSEEVDRKKLFVALVAAVMAAVAFEYVSAIRFIKR